MVVPTNSQQKNSRWRCLVQKHQGLSQIVTIFTRLTDFLILIFFSKRVFLLSNTFLSRNRCSLRTVSYDFTRCSSSLSLSLLLRKQGTSVCKTLVLDWFVWMGPKRLLWHPLYFHQVKRHRVLLMDLLRVVLCEGWLLDHSRCRFRMSVLSLRNKIIVDCGQFIVWKYRSR